MLSREALFCCQMARDRITRALGAIERGRLDEAIALTCLARVNVRNLIIHLPPED